MQRTPQLPRATATSTTIGPVPSASLHARTSVAHAVTTTQSLGKGPVPLQQPPMRRVLQPLDSNRPQVLPSAVAKAPFAYVSRFHRPLSTTTTTSVAKTTTSLTGLKRKQQQLETMVTTQRPEETQDALAQQQRENVAWLDMLVALLERKYQTYAPPVSVEDLERAQMLDAYWPCTNPQPPTTASVEPLPSSSTKRSRLSLDKGTSQDEKEEKRMQALRRHAQQIQDTSVSSTSCCGCKTGCLKITRGYCHEGCSCDNCKNARTSADQRLDAITTYLTNDPRAFSYAASSSTANTGFFQLLPEKSSTVVLRGCRCKKSKCLKKYCECFQNGLGCGPHCRCVDCANDASAAAKELRAKNKRESGGGTTSQSMAGDPTESGSTNGTFHAIKVAVTKKPRRNYVLKSVRLRL